VESLGDFEIDWYTAMRQREHNRICAECKVTRGSSEESTRVLAVPKWQPGEHYVSEKVPGARLLIVLQVPGQTFLRASRALCSLVWMIRDAAEHRFR
jgi:hypothetical protein